MTSSNGSHPCHLACDGDRNLLFVANYGGSFAAFKLDPENGTIGDVVYAEHYGLGSNVVADRQKEAHPHAVNLLGDLVFVTDLGSDKIWRYRVLVPPNDGQGLEKIGHSSTPAGWGPRHMAISDNYAYVVFELETQVGAYSIDPLSGELRSKAFVSTVKEGTKK